MQRRKERMNVLQRMERRMMRMPRKMIGVSWRVPVLEQPLALEELILRLECLW
jgi:hypothetical protein